MFTLFSLDQLPHRVAKIMSVLAAGLVLSLTTLSFTAPSHAQGTIAPPSLGQETKGKPALDELADVEAVNTAPANKTATVENRSSSIFGNAKVVESRRESGQLYLIELEHSSGSKQYIEETGSDTKIESTSNDIEETPNLPKWKLGSW
jgi:hypothetical protein